MSDTVKLIIEIPKEDYEFTKGAETARVFPSEYYVKLILNGTPIPDNATNGDVIKAIFPDLEIANESLSFDNLAYIMAYFGGYKTGLVRGSNSFERTWWDAQYKGGE